MTPKNRGAGKTMDFNCAIHVCFLPFSRVCFQLKIHGMLSIGQTRYSDLMHAVSLSTFNIVRIARSILGLSNCDPQKIVTQNGDNGYVPIKHQDIAALPQVYYAGICDVSAIDV